MSRWQKPKNSHYQGLAGLLVLIIIICAFIVFSYTLETTDVTLTQPPAEILVFDFLRFTYSWQAPPLFAVIAAISVGLIVVVAFVGLELRDENISRRSHDTVRKKLSPWVLMKSTEGVFHGEVTLTVLIPAHNEEKLIEATINSLIEQNRKPDRIIVVADNCTDGTVKVAKRMGVEVFKSICCQAL